MHNFFKQWAKLMPLTVILAILGLICGIIYTVMSPLTYSASVDILVTGAPESITSKDYIAIVNSRELIAPAAIESAELKDAKCSISGTATSSVVTITATCESGAENAKKLSLEAADVFSASIGSILHDEKVFASVISTQDAAPDTSTTMRILRVALPAIAGVLLAAFVAFVKLDHASSLKKTRK